MSITELLASIPVNANLRLEIERLVAERDRLLTENANLTRDLSDARTKSANLAQEIERFKATDCGVQNDEERLRVLNYDPYKNLP